MLSSAWVLNKDKLSHSLSETSKVKWYSVGDNQMVLHKVLFLVFIGRSQKETILPSSLINKMSEYTLIIHNSDAFHLHHEQILWDFKYLLWWILNMKYNS